MKGKKGGTASYDISDIRQIFEDTDAKSWDELSSFIRSEGESVWHVTSEEADNMAKDVELLRDVGEKFTSDPEEVYSLIERYRSEDSARDEHGKSLWKKLFGVEE